MPTKKAASKSTKKATVKSKTVASKPIKSTPELEKAIAFFDDLRKQYAEGKLSKRQINFVEKRLPGLLKGE
jgi:hypothetical protein